MTVLAREPAPAKINLCLFLGPTRADGRHELVTVFDSVGLCDELEVSGSESDEVLCEEVPGPNLVDTALAGLREAGWGAPPVRVVIRKRIPVAAGMGGGSADAAAMLRLAPRLGPVPASSLTAIATDLGADVPAQLTPGPSIGTGAGERVASLGGLPPYAVLVLPQPFGLSTPDVFAEADALELPRGAGELAELAQTLNRALPGALPDTLVLNDLQPAALSLAPGLAQVLDDAAGAGADRALVCGSGPTVIGVFWGTDGPARARRAAQALAPAHPRAVAAEPHRAGLGAGAAND